MNGSIALRGIRAYGRHGANPGERDSEQPFDVDVELECDLEAARRSDALGDTLDYAALHARVVVIVRTHSYELLERLAGEILDDVMGDARVLRASVTVAKPALLDGATPAVTLRAARPPA